MTISDDTHALCYTMLGCARALVQAIREANPEVDPDQFETAIITLGQTEDGLQDFLK